ncbi:hypothetical protein J4418_03980 [Candidatus Woesearchaeota archaeon]|nr:hypothetical protein [Candidatus Woesearchaeota archaeon]
MDKAQAATETLIILAMALIVFLIVFMINQQNISNVNTDFEITKARTALDSIENAANLVYQQGEGAKARIYVNLPNSVKQISINQQTITMLLYGQKSDITVYRNLDYNLNGTIDATIGNQWVQIQSSGNTISIGNSSIVAEDFCGNSIIESGEQCDLLQLGGQTCISQSYDYGTLACTGSCLYDYSGCDNYVCGNNFIESMEICDGTNLTGETCISQGYSGGDLLCQPDCDAFNYSNCTGTDTHPPGRVTNLTNQSVGTNWIYWTWTNPSDADFNSTIIHLNGINIVNTSNTYYNATGLNSDFLYNITLNTKDNSGNINTSAISSIVKTNPIIQIIFYDDFNRANSGTVGIATLGGSWIETGTKWKILNNRAYATRCNTEDKITTSNIDLSTYSKANLTFDWEYIDLDAGECSSLDLNDGGGWISDIWTVCASVANDDLSGSVTLNLASYISLSSTVQLRYACVSSATSENHYIDNVNVTVYG